MYLSLSFNKTSAVQIKKNRKARKIETLKNSVN